MTGERSTVEMLQAARVEMLTDEVVQAAAREWHWGQYRHWRIKGVDQEAAARDALTAAFSCAIAAALKASNPKSRQRQEAGR